MISVLMCVADDAPYVQMAMQSILNQTYKNFQFVIVLDAPTDGSTEIVRNFQDSRITILQNTTRLGLTKSLNEGLRLCTQKWVARQDADDISLPQRLELQIQYLEKNPEIRFLGTQATMIDRTGQFIEHLEKPTKNEEIRWGLFFDNSFVHSSMIFDRGIVAKIGNYNEEFQRTQDYDLWSRLSIDYLGANLPEALLLSRTHATSITAKQPKLSDFYSHRIIQERLQKFGFPSQWADSLSLYRKSQYILSDVSAASELPRVLELFENQYLLRFPSEKDQPYLQAMHSKTLARAAKELAGLSRTQALKLLRSICFRYPSALLKIRWAPWMLKFLLGQRNFKTLLTRTHLQK